MASHRKEFKTPSEAAQFSLALRPTDGNSYDVEGINGSPFALEDLRPHFINAGYRQYRKLTFKITINRPGEAHAEAWLRLTRPHDRAVEILNDFITRIDEPPPDTVDPAIIKKHETVRDLRNKNLLQFNLQAEHLQIFCTAFDGPRFPEHGVTREDVLLALMEYMVAYFVPLRFETATRGDFLVHDKGHLHDPDNPHAYPHVHVFHKLRGYKTTIRIKGEPATHS